MMRRLLPILAVAFACSIVLPWTLAAAQDPTVVVFYREGCEDCLRMEPVLKELEAQHPEIGFLYIEGSDPDAPLMWPMAAEYGVVPSQFPVIFVGDTAIVGASRANELLVRSAVQACATSACPSPLSVVHSSGIPWLTIVLVGLAVLVLGVALLA
jgi:thiol-disulfide isomerase/thioredoxin